MAQYRQLALDWEAARENPPEANRLFLEHHALYQRLRETQSGRAAITALLKDDAAAVRLLAATHSLAWEGERAEGVLEELEWEGGPLGIDAKWTLRSFRQGKLDLDW
jgi:hypothetical protein